MRNYKFTFLFILFYNTIFAQNYSLFNKGIEYFFVSNTGSIVMLKLDTIHARTNNAIEYYNYITTPRNPIANLTQCADLNGASWIGKKIIRQSDGTFLFFNKFNDTIVLKSQATTGQSWKLFSNGSLTIQAQVSDIQTITIGNISDSLKIMTFKTTPSSNYFNDKTITISKNNGICRLYNFYEFPSVSYYDEYDINSIKSMDFVRIFPENSKQKLKNITGNDIFNFEIGDEFHTENINKLLGPQMQYQVYEKKKVIKKIAIADSITYILVVNGTRTEWIGNINPKTFQYKDTIIVTYKNEVWMSLLPGQAFYSKMDGIPVLYEIVKLSLSYNNRILKTTFKYGINQKSENCFSLQSFTPGFNQVYYIDGCGGPFYEGVYDNIWGDHYKLIYFKKGSETWGSPLAVNNDVLIKPKFTIYPIPAKEKIIFELNEYSNQKYQIFLFDNIGQIIVNVPFTNNKLEIKRNGLPNGMYTYRIISTKGEAIIGKVIFN